MIDVDLILNEEITEEIVIVPTNRYNHNINIHNLSLQLIVTSNIIYIIRTRNRKRPSDEQIEIINKKKRVANISPSKVNIINKKKRVANLSISKVNIINQKRRVANISSSKVNVINEKKRAANSTISKVMLINKKKRVANLSLSKKKSNNLKKQNTRKLKKIKINKSINKKDVIKDAIEQMWAQTLSYEDDTDCNFLNPVTLDEKIKCVNDFKSYMNPNNIIYGCAICGIWVTINSKFGKPYKKTIEELESHCLTEEQLINYHNIPLKYKKLKSVTKVKLVNGVETYYHLHRHFLESEMSFTDLDNESPLSAVSITEQVFLCKKCYDSKSFTDVSLSKQIDYGLMNIYTNILPELSVIAKMMLSPIILYSKVLKLSNGTGEFALKGNMIAMENNSVSVLNKVLSVPNLDIPFSVMWTGNLDKLERIQSSNDNRNHFIKTFRNVFHLDLKDLIKWIEFLNYRNALLGINQNLLVTQDTLDLFIYKIIDDI